MKAWRMETELRNLIANAPTSSAALSTASGYFLLSTKDAIDAIEAEKEILFLAGNATTARARLDASVQAHLSATAHPRWYVRPFDWVDGRAVLVIDLDTGDWREVVVAPDELVLTPLFVGLPLAFVAEDGQLISHGIGLSTADWQRDERFIQIPTVYRSLQSFDLNQLGLRAAEEYPALSVVSLAN